MNSLTIAQRKQLMQLLEEGFNLAELELLAAQLGIRQDTLDNSKKSLFIIDLISYHERRKEISQLVAQAREERPILPWDDIISSPKIPERPSLPSSPSVNQATSQIFISYSSKDDKWKERLLTHLSGLLRHQGELAPWSDQESLEVGENWYAAIQEAISQARLVVLLVSPQFLNSSFILKEEVPRFLERREHALIYPIICEPCAWQAVTWLNQMQVRPLRGRPLSQFSKKEMEVVLAELATEIYKKFMLLADQK